MLNRAHHLWGRVEDACAYVAASLIALAMCLTVAEVISRRLLNAPLPGVIDMFDLGMAAIAFLGASQCQRVGGHVRMELVIRKLSGRTLWVAESFTAFCAFGFIAAVAVASAEGVVRAYRVEDSTMDMLLPVWPAKSLVTLALFVLAVRLGLQLFDSLRLAISPAKTPIAALVVASVAELAKDEIADALGNDPEGDA
jgi:TRAP-type C4-dicarboxylate transport system permease small subunit